MAALDTFPGRLCLGVQDGHPGPGLGTGDGCDRGRVFRMKTWLVVVEGGGGREGCRVPLAVQRGVKDLRAEPPARQTASPRLLGDPSSPTSDAPASHFSRTHQDLLLSARLSPTPRLCSDPTARRLRGPDSPRSSPLRLRPLVTGDGSGWGPLRPEQMMRTRASTKMCLCGGDGARLEAGRTWVSATGAGSRGRDPSRGHASVRVRQGTLLKKKEAVPLGWGHGVPDLGYSNGWRLG